jgi:hypothetical protein
MPTLNLSESVDQRNIELRSLRRLINAPTQRVVDEIQQSLRKLNANIYTPEELSKLLVPIINEVLQKRIAATEREVVSTLTPIIDKVFAERTQQDKSVIINALAPTVAKALKERHEKFPDEVAEDLAPLMGAAIREQVRLQRDAMVDALYPIIGATIAKYMGEALRQFTENVNKKIENTFSFKGLARKAQAKVSGVSEAELILSESLPFSVEAAFLIHKSSGLLITEARSEGTQYDSDLVSGMLTAIRSFVNDWIARTGDVSEIDAIEYGRSKIMLEVAGHCYLAVVVEGEPPQQFVYNIRETLAHIIAESDREISAFQGDFSFIPTSVQERIRSLVVKPDSQNAIPTRKPSLARSLLQLAGVLFLLAAIPLGWYFYRQHQDGQTERVVTAAISSTLGFTNNPITVAANGENVHLSGNIPNDLLKQRAVQAAKLASPASIIHEALVLPEGPLHPAIVAADVDRVVAAFSKIRGVEISSSYKLLGTVPDKLLEKKIITEIERLPGVSIVASSFKKSRPTIDQAVYFTRATEFADDAPATFQRIKKLMSEFPSIRVRIIGYCDGLGTMAMRIPLTLARLRGTGHRCRASIPCFQKTVVSDLKSKNLLREARGECHLLKEDLSARRLRGWENQSRSTLC